MRSTFFTDFKCAILNGCLQAPRCTGPAQSSLTLLTKLTLSGQAAPQGPTMAY